MPKKRGPQPRNDIMAARLKRLRGRPIAGADAKVKSKEKPAEQPEGSAQAS